MPLVVVSEGLWRGAPLVFSGDEDQVALVGIVYKIGLTAKFLLSYLRFWHPR